uniref:Uncharacterized protein n=1 Tax=Rhizophora mucronata TaxID=61149 RepID=A0A2P2PJM9_RHIMU
MVQKLEAIKGDGGSIRIGATGTIGFLMTKELESIKSTPQTPVSCRDKPGTNPVSFLCSSTTTPRRLQARKSLDEASSSSSTGSSINRKSPETPRKLKTYGSTHKIPMLASDVMLDKTPSREKTGKRGTNFVEVVDISCGNLDRALASPITTKLKRLGFTKLSESIV